MIQNVSNEFEVIQKQHLPFAGTGSDLSPSEWGNRGESIVGVALAGSDSGLVDTGTVVGVTSVSVIGQVTAVDSLTVTWRENIS